MIELIAHKDNAWPGAFRLHMKDTGMLLGIGRDVKAVAAARLIEEGMLGTFHVAFASGGPGMRGEAAYGVMVELPAVEVTQEPEPASPPKPKKVAAKKKR